MTFACLFITLSAAATTLASESTSQPVLLDFHAEWCGPCQKMRRAVQTLTEQGYPVKSVDIDQEPELAARYRVHEVPTFVVLDGAGRVLARTKGSQPAAELARFYNAAVARVQPPSNSNAHAAAADDEHPQAESNDEHDGSSESTDNRRHDSPSPRAEAQERNEPAPVNPKPWETVVRIRVLNARSIGFGSGTIIHSTPDESLILTCAHIFKLDGRRQAPPAQFPRQIMIDLFDGNLRGTNPAQVHCIGSVEGKAVDYDFKRDVGLIRIRPGRRVPAARVVPAHWQPKARMRMLTVGCSEGHDATAWHTIIVKPRTQGLAGNDVYEAMECLVAPKQGRSGGGLFTTDGYIAGVCNFAEPMGDHGLYAAPHSIYSLLDRNQLMALYAPATGASETLVADRGPDARRIPSEPISVARSQSPDQEGPAKRRRRDRAESERASASDVVMIPPPSLLGIADPVSPQTDGLPKAAAAIAQRAAWQPAHESALQSDSERVARPSQTDLNLDPSADHDRFGPAPTGKDTAEAGSRLHASMSAARPNSPESAPTRPRWRAIKVSSPRGNATESE
jgi:thiol-disulfide isomerase/thioredoxin